MPSRILAQAMLLQPCLGLLAACSAWDEDTPDRVEFALPSYEFSFTDESPEWRQPPPEGFPDMVCAGSTALSKDCCNPPYPNPSVDCQVHPLACNPEDNRCALVFDIVRSRTVDLVGDVPEMAAAQGRIFSSVTLVRLDIEVKSLLSVRSADLAIAPDDDSRPSPGATRLAQIPLATGTFQLAAETAGGQAFAALARDRRFTWLVSAHVVLPQKDSDVQGQFLVVVGGKAVALY
jgi:hypothetical protein